MWLLILKTAHPICTAQHKLPLLLEFGVILPSDKWAAHFIKTVTSELTMCHLNQTLKRILLCVLTHGSRNMSPTFWSDLQSLFGFLSPDRQTWWTCFLAGCYQPSYEVMLRFYSLYKQAVCGPCTVARPSFWDPVGRYKWYVCVHVLVYHCNQSLVSFQVQIHQLISCFLFLLNVFFFFFL